MRLIDAEALEEEIIKTQRYVPKDAVLDVACMVNRAPTIEAKPVVHASWTEVSGGRIICDHCGNYPLYDYFGRINLSRCCPTCGALMSNGGHWLFRKAEEYLKENNCGAQMDELVSKTDELNSSVKIPVMSMKDICRKIMCDR